MLVAFLALGAISEGAAKDEHVEQTISLPGFPSEGPEFNLKQAWRGLITAPGAIGGWADGVGERYGQVCDPWRRPDTAVWPPEDDNNGCVAVWLSQRGDNFTVGNLPRDQQNNFQNTLHYHQAWNFDNVGFKGDTLPIGGVDIDPVCYIANISGRVALGYEEGNGDVLMPCPGGRGGYDFSEESILNASDDKLKSMCEMCYQAVCSKQESTYPKACGRDREGGVNIEGENVSDLQQVGNAYHCHLTMANDGACDYVQYDQHEESRDYNMSSGVMCGWKNVRYLNLTYCDCTREAGTANNCQQAECLKMALNGVVCGNCGSCNQETAYRQIFSQYIDREGNYDGVCALARTAPTEELRANYTMLCSQGLFCRENNSRNRARCNIHCEMFPDSPVCPNDEPADSDAGAARRLLAVGTEHLEAADDDVEAADEAQIIRTISIDSKGARKLRMV